MGDLNALANHYGVDVDQRHTALGDAVITGQIFRAMLPDLKARSINTLADAMRAVSRLDEIRLSTTRAGWVDVAAKLNLPLAARPLHRIDPFPYQHRIGEMMIKNAGLKPAQDRICRQIDGIVSERDLIETFALPVDQGERARTIPLGEIMSSPVQTVFADLLALDIRHLGVTNRDGTMLGWISTRELIRQRVSNALLIGDQLASAESPEEMAEALAALPMTA